MMSLFCCFEREGDDILAVSLKIGYQWVAIRVCVWHRNSSFRIPSFQFLLARSSTSVACLGRLTPLIFNPFFFTPPPPAIPPPLYSSGG